MSRRQKDPLRSMSAEERAVLSRLSRSRGAPAAQVARAAALLAVADGQSYTAAARKVGRRDNDTVARWVASFNRDGPGATLPRHGGGPPIRYADDEQRRILAEAARVPDRDRDGTATWSLSTLRAALRRAGDGLPTVSTYTIWHTLHAAGLSWQKTRTWCDTGVVRRRRGRRGHGHRPRRRREKKLIEHAYELGARMGLAVWCEDEAGPLQTVPHRGGSWRREGRPATQPHEYVRAGTAKILTLFHPATGRVSLRPATSGTNTVLHGWLKEALGQIVAALPARGAPPDPAGNRALWPAWQGGAGGGFSLPPGLPPLRVLPVWDTLAGHKTPEMVLWLCRHGIMPLYTPLGGSWLNMAESIQRILKRRALDGQHPSSPAERAR